VIKYNMKIHFHAFGITTLLTSHKAINKLGLSVQISVSKLLLSSMSLSTLLPPYYAVIYSEIARCVTEKLFQSFFRDSEDPTSRYWSEMDEPKQQLGRHKCK